VRRLSQAGEVWVIFDNTATRAAADNARGLMVVSREQHRSFTESARTPDDAVLT